MVYNGSLMDGEGGGRGGSWATSVLGFHNPKPSTLNSQLLSRQPQAVNS